ncbi:DUF5946 family protein [Actinomadura rifamycini]|uniref:DUF5946 family protein n=1 Tax=Actinomadura rifamycini TaxID=31962 RepID=UPI00041B261E|nr:DUF5946 family protein [Actinomadura rifamycini]
MTNCPECGGPGPCDDLFQELLALDHSRREPWGPLHGVSVACFVYQHPSRLVSAPPFGWTILDAFLRDGRAGAERVVSGFRRANSHRRREGPATGARAPSGTPPARFAVTIAEVAGDGTFPADGFPDRVREWAAATVEAWTARPE